MDEDEADRISWAVTDVVSAYAAGDAAACAKALNSMNPKDAFVGFYGMSRAALAECDPSNGDMWFRIRDSEGRVVNPDDLVALGEVQRAAVNAMRFMVASRNNDMDTATALFFGGGALNAKRLVFAICQFIVTNELLREPSDET